MSTKLGMALTMGFLLALGQACDDPAGPSKPKPITELPRALTSAETQVIAKATSFGFDLLREADSRRKPDQPNTIISPFSASMALGMALEGAEGETFLEMQSTLGFEGMARGDINDSYAGLMDLLLTLDPEVEIGIANSAWARQGYPFLQGFFDALTHSFDAVVQELDFDGPGATETINQWVSDRTKGMIEEIIDEIGPDDILFLINAVYFKGDWTTQFKKSETSAGPFKVADNTTLSVPMMSGGIEDAGFAWVDGGRVVAELPYGGQAFGMVLVLPGEGETVDDLMADLDGPTWNGWMDGLHKHQVEVQMPKFELEWDGTFNDALKAMGMPKAFDSFHADFSRMTPAQVHISAIRQKTYMRVDEEGTEAAAVTSVNFADSASPGITVDRPYLLAIRERLSGTILFLGAVRDPR